MYEILHCYAEEDGIYTKRTHEVIIEEQYTIWVNGRKILNAMTSPTRLEEFVTGYLLTEGIISQIEEIDSLQIEGNQIRVLTIQRAHVHNRTKTVLSGCGGSTSYLDPARLAEINSDLQIPGRIIHEKMNEILDSNLHRLTGGIHVVGLADVEKVHTVAEDIGRHNALDRVVGYALQHKIDLSHCYAIISGRISSEMARKCLVANIPVIASRGATTTLAIRLAQGKRLTIIGFVRGRKMNIYTHPERISGIDVVK